MSTFHERLQTIFHEKFQWPSSLIWGLPAPSIGRWSLIAFCLVRALKWWSSPQISCFLSKEKIASWADNLTLSKKSQHINNSLQLSSLVEKVAPAKIWIQAKRIRKLQKVKIVLVGHIPWMKRPGLIVLRLWLFNFISYNNSWSDIFHIYDSPKCQFFKKSKTVLG